MRVIILRTDHNLSLSDIRFIIGRSGWSRLKIEMRGQPGYGTAKGGDMSSNPLLPDNEDLRKAVKWISLQGEFNLKTVDEASLRFDLSPADEDFLINHFTGKPAGEEDK